MVLRRMFLSSTSLGSSSLSTYGPQDSSRLTSKRHSCGTKISFHELQALPRITSSAGHRLRAEDWEKWRKGLACGSFEGAQLRALWRSLGSEFPCSGARVLRGSRLLCGRASSGDKTLGCVNSKMSSVNTSVRNSDTGINLDVHAVFWDVVRRWEGVILPAKLRSLVFQMLEVRTPQPLWCSELIFTSTIFRVVFYISSRPAKNRGHV